MIAEIMDGNLTLKFTKQQLSRARTSRSVPFFRNFGIFGDFPVNISKLAMFNSTPEEKLAKEAQSYMSRSFYITWRLSYG